MRAAHAAFRAAARAHSVPLAAPSRAFAAGPPYETAAPAAAAAAAAPTHHEPPPPTPTTFAANPPMPYTLAQRIGEEKWPGAANWVTEAGETFYPPPETLFPGAKEHDPTYTERASDRKAIRVYNMIGVNPNSRPFRTQRMREEAEEKELRDAGVAGGRGLDPSRRDAPPSCSVGLAYYSTGSVEGAPPWEPAGPAANAPTAKEAAAAAPAAKEARG